MVRNVDFMFQKSEVQKGRTGKYHFKRVFKLFSLTLDSYLRFNESYGETLRLEIRRLFHLSKI